MDSEFDVEDAEETKHESGTKRKEVDSPATSSDASGTKKLKSDKVNW